MPWSKKQRSRKETKRGSQTTERKKGLQAEQDHPKDTAAAASSQKMAIEAGAQPPLHLPAAGMSAAPRAVPEDVGGALATGAAAWTGAATGYDAAVGDSAGAGTEPAIFRSDEVTQEMAAGEGGGGDDTFAAKLGLGSMGHVLKLGSSFSNTETPFHTIRYDFKPASMDKTKNSTLDVGQNNEVTVIAPHLDGARTSETVFRGCYKPHKKKCVLIIDHNTGEIVIEKLCSNVQVKITRKESSSQDDGPMIPEGGRGASSSSSSSGANGGGATSEGAFPIGTLSESSSTSSGNNSDADVEESSVKEKGRGFSRAPLSMPTHLLSEDLQLSESDSE